MREREDSARGRLAVRVQDRDEHDGEQNENDHSPDAAARGNRPRGGRTAIGLEHFRERLGSPGRHRLPSVGHLPPTTGMSSSHAGGGPSPFVRKSFITAGLRPAASSIVLIARANGTMKTRSTRRVISATASARRPPAARSSRSSSGQVATVIVVAQIIPLRNGSSVQRLARSSVPITSTNRIIRVMSLGPSARMCFLTPDRAHHDNSAAILSPCSSSGRRRLDGLTVRIERLQLALLLQDRGNVRGIAHCDDLQPPGPSTCVPRLAPRRRYSAIRAG